MVVQIAETEPSSTLGDILAGIEELRSKMHLFAMEKGITHPEVLFISQDLDEKINQYNRMKYSIVNK